MFVSASGIGQDRGVLATSSTSGLTTASSSPGSGPSWLPWVIVGVVLVVALVAGLLVRRSRRRFERTHHVQDEHGRRVDPASLLDDETIEDVADRALVTVDDALLASRQELERAPDLPAATEALQRAADVLAEAFAVRNALDHGEPSDEAGRRAAAGRIITACEQVDDLLDAAAPEVATARALGDHLPDLLDTVEREVDSIATGGDDPLVDLLLAAARSHAQRARGESRDERRKAVGHLRVAEQAVDQARIAAAAVGTDDAALRVATLVATRRGAVSALARARLRRDDATTAALEQAESDVATWRPEHARKADDQLRGLLLAGVLVPSSSSSWRGAFGGTSHGDGANRPFRGSGRIERLVAAGFGGRRTTDERPTIVRP